MAPLDRSSIEAAFRAACRAELHALKPGNVHVFASGHGMTVKDFERSAEAAAPFVADPALRVGERILRGVEASFAATGCNTNLGILLLAAPLAAAAERTGTDRDLRTGLGDVLANLDAADARAVYEAIRTANPGGLGTTKTADVALPPDMPLVAAMRLAADRDKIAEAYVTDFAVIFDFGLPHLANAQERGGEAEAEAVTALHMAFLAAFPDSHIARKYGIQAAHRVQKEARELQQTGLATKIAATFSRLMAFDVSLKRRGLNPGTTADLVVATLFAGQLTRKLAA